LEADWEVEVGGSAPVIEAHWPGFIDLRTQPLRISDIAEAKAFPPLAALLLALNSGGSPVWTSKCDVWAPDLGAMACYVDLLPLRGGVFAEWERAEAFCRVLVKRIAPRTATAGETQPGQHPILVLGDGRASAAALTLVVRRAITEQFEGFGVTAYFSADAHCSPDAATAIAAAMVAFSNALVSTASHISPNQS
jgi:hypothetical protein